MITTMPGTWYPCAGKLQSYRYNSRGQVIGIADGNDDKTGLVEKQKAKAIKQAKKLLLREGIISESQLVF